MIKAGVFGASGYMGGEALRILYEHPEVEIKWATSRSGKMLTHFHRNFYEIDIPFIHPDNISEVDVVFFALPSGHAMQLAYQFRKNGTKIIDLGADFRLKDEKTWKPERSA